MSDALKTVHELLRPNKKPRMIDLVAQAGLDVSDWSNFAGGAAKAGANPKYCYEWSYEQEGMILLNIWYENMDFAADRVIQRLNLKNRPTDMHGVRRARAKRFDELVRHAFHSGANPRAIIQHRSKPGEGGVEARMLDPAPWTVTEYNASTGDFVLQRGIVPYARWLDVDEELDAFPEGEIRDRFVRHRHREARLRKIKIANHASKNSGLLPCEVPGCGFDYENVYGALGRGFAQVHHLTPLADMDDKGSLTSVDDLAVVCANCHAMIHRGGANRDMETLLQKDPPTDV